MDKKISVIIKDPGKKPRHVYISPTLQNLQKIVGGYIETVTFSKDLVMICDEEGKLKGKEVNFPLGYDLIVGTAVFIGVNRKGDFCDIPLSYDSFRGLFDFLWRV